MPEGIPIQPYYFFLAGVIMKSGWVCLILGLSYALFWPLLMSVGLLAPTRMLFAFSIDGILPKAIAKVGRGQAPWAAVLLTIAIVLVALIWAVFITNSFFQVIVYATMIELVAMGLVGLSALLFPWRRPDLYRASVSTKRIAGAPVVSIAGLAALVSSAILVYLYFHYEGLGLEKPGQFFLVAAITFGLAVVYWLVARQLQSREGTNLGVVYKEIPPE
jgi:amino acid transporter